LIYIPFTGKRKNNMKQYLAGATDELLQKAQKIRLLITDVDGVLTDGGIIFDDNGLEYKKFNVKDGYIISALRRSGIMVGAITGRTSRVVENRCEELNFDFHYHGVMDKRKKFMEIIETLEIELDEVAFIGDDLIDLPMLCMVGLSACPADALPYVSDKVDFVTSLDGGKGCFREVSDMILTSKGVLEEMIQKLSQKHI
jgi:3-deoxy-D-manno-octulosonate 8-phosphate phosphatase (KDO 8-P phosphatase)